MNSVIAFAGFAGMILGTSLMEGSKDDVGLVLGFTLCLAGLAALYISLREIKL
jgi:hypothetical protein